jgi:tRNA threonylcarbamoyladenosine biosynthesis protein TsaE
VTSAVLPTVEDTRAFGARLAAILRAGDLIVLDGPLGAGKTALTQGIGAGLGVSGRVVSPTFVIARVHRGGRVPLVHVDAYRLASITEVDDLDLEVETADVVTVVEWGRGLVEQLTGEWLLVSIERPADAAAGVTGADDPGADGRADPRRVSLTPNGGDWADRLAALTD